MNRAPVNPPELRGFVVMRQMRRRRLADVFPSDLARALLGVELELGFAAIIVDPPAAFLARAGAAAYEVLDSRGFALGAQCLDIMARDAAISALDEEHVRVLAMTRELYAAINIEDTSKVVG